MKTLSALIAKHGIRRLSRDLIVNEATAWKWCQQNRAPRWRIDALEKVLGEFSMSKRRVRQ